MPVQVSSTRFRFRAVAAAVMRKIVQKNGVCNLTIRQVPNRGEDREKFPVLFVIVRQSND